MVGKDDRVEELHRHYVEVLTRLKAQLGSNRATMGQFDLSLRQRDVAGVHPEMSAGPSASGVHGMKGGTGSADNMRDGIRVGRRATFELGAHKPNRAASTRRVARAECPSSAPSLVRSAKRRVAEGAPCGEDTKRLRNQCAEIADEIAESADIFASLLEETAARGDSGRRQGVAATERQLAMIERRNAARRRDSRSRQHLGLEGLPHLPDGDRC